MHKILVIPCLVLCVSGMAQAVDYQQLGESVDTTIATESVDQEKAIEAAKEQDVQKGYESVDKTRAGESVDTDKAMDALMK